MLQTAQALGGMVVAPHHLAAQAGRDVLREGGSAAEATVAAAATIAVVYPHMNSIGGDGFWLLAEPGRAPVGIDASGPAVTAAGPSFYRDRGYQDAIPARGPHAALTVPGTVAGWQRALEAPGSGARRMPLARLLQPAVEHARRGVAVTTSMERLLRDKRPDLEGAPGFAETYMVSGQVPGAGSLLYQPRLADTLEHLGKEGLDAFYRGEIAEALARDLLVVDSPISGRDLGRFHADAVTPLALDLACGRVYNLPAPTQGAASLMILGLFERMGVTQAESFAHVHGLVEATKAAFRVRDRVITDPGRLPSDPAAYLDPEWLAAAAGMIQSLYWEFGSGVVSPSTGILLQNRGMSFSLDPASLQALEPGRKPFHTLNPAMARLSDGRTLVYGTMGGEGQPQTQAAVFSRHVHFGQPLQEAVTAPRWLLGRTWGSASTSLKLESRFDPELIQALRRAGHEVEVVGPFVDAMGHAGAISRRTDGLLAGAADPRSDGQVAAV